MRRLDVVKQYGFHYLRTTFKQRESLDINYNKRIFPLFPNLFSKNVVSHTNLGFRKYSVRKYTDDFTASFFFKDATKVSSFTEQLIRRYTCTRVLVVETRARDRN